MEIEHLYMPNQNLVWLFYKNESRELWACYIHCAVTGSIMCCWNIILVHSTQNKKNPLWQCHPACTAAAFPLCIATSTLCTGYDVQGALGDCRNTLRQISDKCLCFASKRSIATGQEMKELIEYATIHIAFTIQPYNYYYRW